MKQNYQLAGLGYRLVYHFHQWGRMCDSPLSCHPESSRRKVVVVVRLYKPLHKRPFSLPGYPEDYSIAHLHLTTVTFDILFHMVQID